MSTDTKHKTMMRYFEDRATGRDSESAYFKNDWGAREKAVREFLEFAGFDSADALIAKFEESTDTKKEIGLLLYKFYLKKTESMKKTSAKMAAMRVAAMFTANELKIRTKRISKEAKETSAVRKARAKEPFFDYDEEEGYITGFNDLARDFFGRLNHRDRTVLLASASSGQPVSVILALTIGDIRQTKKRGQTRIVLMGDRSKTGEAYLTFVSIEATKMIYATLEYREDWKAENVRREDANKFHKRNYPMLTGAPDDSEPLFMARALESLKTNHLAKSTRRVCDALGIIRNGTNPYTPYAMRSVFRTACDGVPSIIENVKKQMMGHSLTEGEGYNPLGTSGILPHYMKVEQLLTLAHQPSEAEKIQSKRIDDLELKVTLRDADIHHLEEMVKELGATLSDFVGGNK